MEKKEGFVYVLEEIHDDFIYDKTIVGVFSSKELAEELKSDIENSEPSDGKLFITEWKIDSEIIRHDGW